MIARTMRPVAAIVVVVLAMAWLWSLGHGELAPPPVGSLDDLGEWFEARPPEVAVFALVRLGGLGLAGYVLAVVVLGLAARATKSRSVLRAADAAIPPGLRRVTASLFGIGLMGAAAGPLAGDRAAPTESLVVVDRLAPDEAREVLVPLDDGASSSDGVATVSLVPPVKAEPPQSSPAAIEQWVVRPGDHLWSIAESHLRDVLGRPPTDAEIAPYWRVVVEHNRARLSDPNEPDLIFAGQVVELPQPAAGGA